ASRKRVFVVEVHGGKCGFLASMAGLEAGASCVYTPEEGMTLEMQQRDVRRLCKRFAEQGERSAGRLVLRSEAASNTYDTPVLARIIQAEGGGAFDTRTSILGHLQQGGTPAPVDRMRAHRSAVHCVKWLEQHAWKCMSSHREKAPIAVHGIVASEMTATPVEH